MIKATIREKGFRIEGHANYAPSGYDIVCAGVSALVAASMGMLDFMINEINQGEGIVDVTVVENDLGERFDVVIEMLHYGLVAIQKQYPNHLEVHYET